MAAKTIDRGKPFGIEIDFQREVDEAFSRICGRGEPSALSHGTPPMELSREGDEYVIRLDLPGSDPEEVDISLVENTMRVRGTRRRRLGHQEYSVLHSEIVQGPFERTLELPEPLRPEEIRATYKHGVLEVRIRPSRNGPRRRVPIEFESK